MRHAPHVDLRGLRDLNGDTVVHGMLGRASGVESEQLGLVFDRSKGGAKVALLHSASVDQPALQKMFCQKRVAVLVGPALHEREGFALHAPERGITEAPA